MEKIFEVRSKMLKCLLSLLVAYSALALSFEAYARPLQPVANQPGIAQPAHQPGAVAFQRSVNLRIVSVSIPDKLEFFTPARIPNGAFILWPDVYLASGLANGTGSKGSLIVQGSFYLQPHLGNPNLFTSVITIGGEVVPLNNSVVKWSFPIVMQLPGHDDPVTVGVDERTGWYTLTTCVSTTDARDDNSSDNCISEDVLVVAPQTN